MTVSDEDKLFADMWMKQKDLFLRFVSFVPLIEIAILASWFPLARDKREILAQTILLGGAVVMVAATVMMWRIIQYVSYFRSKLDRFLVGMPDTLFTSRRVGLTIPLLCIITNIVLALATTHLFD